MRYSPRRSVEDYQFHLLTLRNRPLGGHFRTTGHDRNAPSIYYKGTATRRMASRCSICSATAKSAPHVAAGAVGPDATDSIRTGTSLQAAYLIRRGPNFNVSTAGAPQPHRLFDLGGPNALETFHRFSAHRFRTWFPTLGGAAGRGSAEPDRVKNLADARTTRGRSLFHPNIEGVDLERCVRPGICHASAGPGRRTGLARRRVQHRPIVSERPKAARSAADRRSDGISPPRRSQSGAHAKVAYCLTP
jgi:hypothetical protein